MSDILYMINAKNKAVNIINSCFTRQHLDVANTYIELFKNKFDDFLSYTELRKLLQNKKESLNLNV